jgi:hypothetical protein
MPGTAEGFRSTVFAGTALIPINGCQQGAPPAQEPCVVRECQTRAAVEVEPTGSPLGSP